MKSAQTDTEAIQAIVAEFSLILDELQGALDDEKSALEARDIDALAHASEQKNALCQKLADAKFGSALTERIAALPAEERALCEVDHTNALSRLQEVRDSNLVNGKILNRSQNSLREILHLLSGRASDGLYGESGQPNSDTESGRESIARV